MVIHPLPESIRLAEDTSSFSSVMIKSLCFEGQLNEALHAVKAMHRQGLQVPTQVLHYILQGCMEKEDLTVGRTVHFHIVTSGLEAHASLGNHLIRMFAVCGSLVDAMNVFSKLCEPNVFTWSAIISAHAKLGQGEQAIQLYYQMQKGTMKPDGHVFVAVLKACASTAAEAHGKLIHSHFVGSITEFDVFVGNALIDMYSKCGSCRDARMVFDTLPKRDVVTWSVMITAYVEQGDGEGALQLFDHMKEEGIEPDTVILICVLKACSRLAVLDRGKLIHVHVIKNGFEFCLSAANTIIDMYAKCGSLEDGLRVFHSLLVRSVVTWNTLISGYASVKNRDAAIELFQQMLQEGLQPNQATFVSILRVCSSTSARCVGQWIHVYVNKSSFDLDLRVGNSLIDMYAKCGSLEDACRVFYTLPKQDLVTWNAIISGHAEYCHVQGVLNLFHQMSQYGIKSDGVTFVSILKACSSMIAIKEGKLIHNLITESGFDSDRHVGNSLIDMYMKCGHLDDARWVFQGLPKRDLIAWSTVLAGCAQHGQGQEALELFQHMQEENMELDTVTFVCILNALSNIAALHQGRLIYVHIVKTCFESDLVVGNTLIDMYAKCGYLEDANRIFDRLPVRNVVTWNAMIAGYVEYGHCQEACQLFLQMQKKGMEPNQVTCGCILKTCSSTANLHQGKLYHAYIIKRDFECDVFVGNTLIDMYSNCGSLEDACKIFDRLPHRDMVTWNAMISGYATFGYGQDMLSIFQKMLRDGMKPDPATFVCILKACSSILALHQSKLVHYFIIKYGFEFDLIVGNTLVDMYANCRSLEDACIVFNNLSKKDLVSWGAMIAGCVQNSKYKLALHYVEHMQQQGLKPNDVIFGCLLSACNHLGLVNEGYHHFKSMAEKHNIAPTVDDHNCMIDLLGRAGHLNEADDMLQSMPYGPNIVGLISLLSHCRNHGNVALAQRCFDCLLKVDCKKAGVYMCMSNIYAHCGLHEEAHRVEEMRKSSNAWKEPGRAFIEVSKTVHNFTVGSTQHPQIHEIYAKLKFVILKMKEEGYMPCSHLLMQSMPDEGWEYYFEWPP